jgi:hypothetical protein
MRVDDMELQRLGQGGEPPASLEARAGAFLHAARATTGLAESEIRAIERQLGQPGRARPSLLVPALVGLTVLLVTGTVMAVIGGWRPRLSKLGSGDPPFDSQSVARARTRVRTEVTPMALPAPAAPAEERPAAVFVQPPLRREPAPHRISRVEIPPPAAPAPNEAPTPEGALSVEARSLANALARWRRDAKAEQALALLAEHDHRFPHGALGIESRVARAEILLGLSRRAQALAVLDSLTLSSLPRARELETLRGELRAQFGRCTEARADLARVMSITEGDDLGKRAARALATCP